MSRYYNNYVNLDSVPDYLRQAGVPYNKGDKWFANGDLGLLKGEMEVWGGRCGTARFEVESFDNGMFVRYSWRGDRKCVEVKG